MPIEVRIETARYLQMQVATHPSPASFEVPGQRRVFASFRGVADTVVVTVVEKRRL